MAEITRTEAAASKERLHRLVDELPERVLATAENTLRSLRQGNPMLQAIENAAEDDEPVNEEELQAIEEGMEAARRGDLHRLEDVKRELGL